MLAGLANLPLIATMILATPLTEALVRALGHRYACLVGAALLAAGLGLMAWAVDVNYLAIAVAMVVMTAGLRTVMTICAVALVGALPRTAPRWVPPERHRAGGRHEPRHRRRRHAHRCHGHVGAPGRRVEP
jgi:MFS family permease